MNRIIKGILAGVAFFFLAGCEKGGLPNSGSVSFTASAGDEETRTSYSGVIVTSGGVDKERIDWVVGDCFTVYSDKAATLDGSHVTDYMVESKETTSDKLRSKAKVGSVVAHGLQWGTASGNVVFYAGYPEGTMNTTPRMTGTIPTSQTLTWSGLVGKPDMSKAYMFASATAQAQASSVELVFYPKFTAFEFEVSPGDNSSVALTSFELSSSSKNLAGKFTLTPSSGAMSVSSGSKKITVSLSGKTLTSGNTLKFTVFTLAKEDLTDLTIKFVGTEIGTRTLDLKNSSGTFHTYTAGRKHKISGLSFPKTLDANGNDGIVWTYSAAGEKVTWDSGTI